MLERRTFMGSLVAMVGGLVLPPTPALVLPGADYRRQTFRIGFGSPKIQNRLPLTLEYPMLYLGMNQLLSTELRRVLSCMDDPQVNLVYDGRIANDDGL